MSNDLDVGLSPDMELDVLVVGSGFGGVHQLYNYRKLGYSVKIFEAANDLGGVWYWNCYPGARVDSEIPVYEFSMEELWKDWNWSERFPGYEELRKYFAYVDRKLDLKKDICFGKRVVSARFDTHVDRWTVVAHDGTTVHARFFVLCIGFAAKPYIPSFSGFDLFEGICHHTAVWPQEGVEFTGKKVGVIGTGASGVQVIQEIAPVVEYLTVFQRTPNYAIAMQQRTLDEASQMKRKAMYPMVYRRRRQTFGGSIFDRYPKSLFATTPEERLLYWEETWAKGGFCYIASNYQDILTNQDANDEVYAFWRRKVRERLNDPGMQEKLAPAIPPHPFGAKRPCLEQHYYEVYNQSNVKLIDLKEIAITKFTPTGILTHDGTEHELDIIVLATGFDSVTGGITQIDIHGKDGTTIHDKWAQGVYTNLGMTTANFPNMFFMYGPQGPTAFCNGPTCIEIQGEWIVNCIKHTISKNLTRIEATREAEEEWRKLVLQADSLSLMNKAKSWYNGANIPGKVVEPLNFLGSVKNYDYICMEKAREGYDGFTLSRKE